MAKRLTLDEKVDQMLVDLAIVKTDVVWLKRIFLSTVLLTGAVFGIDMSGVVV
jgi:hypothetical protein